MSDTGRRPRWGFRLLAALLVVLVVDALGWAVAVHALRSRLDLWSRSGRASGWQVGYATPREAGWPFGAALDLDRPHVVVRGGLAWSAATARIGSGLFDPWWISLASHGQQTLALPCLDLPPFRAADIAGAGWHDTALHGRRPAGGTGAGLAPGAPWRARRDGGAVAGGRRRSGGGLHSPRRPAAIPLAIAALTC